MIASWMLYALAVSALILLFGITAEHLVTLYRLPRRWVWVVCALAIMVAGVAVPLRGSLDRPVGATSATDTPVLTELSPAIAVPGSLSTTLWHPLRMGALGLRERAVAFNRPLILGWLVGTALLGCWLLAGWALLARRRRHWRDGVFAGESVLVSMDDGPAILGVFRPRIVVPEWSLDCDLAAQQLILDHEQEHLRAGDHLLTRLSGVILLVMPWNLPLWILARRLRLAIELDCDQRLLRRTALHTRDGAPDVAGYADLLLTVAQQRQGRRSTLEPALFTSQSTLARRLLAMSTASFRYRPLQSMASLGAASALAWLVVLMPAPRLSAQQIVQSASGEVLRARGTSASAPAAPASAAETRALLQRYYPSQGAGQRNTVVGFVRNADGTITDTVSLRTVAEVGAATRQSLLADVVLEEKLNAEARAVRSGNLRRKQAVIEDSVAMATETGVRSKGTLKAVEKDVEKAQLREIQARIIREPKAKWVELPTEAIMEKDNKRMQLAKTELELKQKVLDKEMLLLSEKGAVREVATMQADPLEQLWQEISDQDKLPLSVAARRLALATAAIDIVTFPAGQVGEQGVTVYYITRKPVGVKR